jgi:glycosyltransferase involved in cell wall biosynthesis
MRIGISTLFLTPSKHGGTETYLRGLLTGLASVDGDNEYVIFTNTINHDSLDLNAPNFTRHLCRCSGKSRVTRIAYEQLFLPGIVTKYGIDILHSPGYVSPVTGKFGKVVTIHDMQYIYYPNYFPKARLLYWKYFLPISARKSDIILTVSENSRADIVNLLNISKDKVFVTYEAPKFCADSNKGDSLPPVMKKYNIRDNYILSVASLLPHKNLDRLIEAFALLEDKINHQLVCVGIKGHALDDIGRTIRNKLNHPDRVAILGYISDQDLAAIYKGADLFILPSLFEGFGIPLLEAMALGCPVAASNRTSIPEIVGDAAVLFDPEDTQGIADAMLLVLSNQSLRNDLVHRGLLRAKLFSWHKMAKETLNVYNLAYNIFCEKK